MWFEDSFGIATIHETVGMQPEELSEGKTN